MNYSYRALRLHHWLAIWAIISALEIIAADPVNNIQAVIAFKKHLSTPPCYSRILFSEADCSNNVTRSYYVAICGDNYVYRTLYGGENIDLPVSVTNRNRSSVYVGRWGDMHWAIAGYDLTIAVNPLPAQPLPDGSSYVFVNELLTFGFQHVQAGTFVWNGRYFEAKPSVFARELGQTENLSGEIIVEGGVVKRMIVNTAGVSEFQYDTSGTNIPYGLPSIISRLTPDGRCTSRWIIHDMIKAVPSDTAMLFDPKHRIQSDIAVIRVISNGVERIATAQNPQLRNNLLREQLADFVPLTQRELGRRSFVRSAFGVLVVLLTGLGIWRMHKKLTP